MKKARARVSDMNRGLTGNQQWGGGRWVTYELRWPILRIAYE